MTPSIPRDVFIAAIEKGIEAARLGRSAPLAGRHRAPGGKQALIFTVVD